MTAAIPNAEIFAGRNNRRLLGGAVAVLGLSATMTQLALLRESLGAFSGNEMVLGIVLGNWLLLMGLGAAAGRFFDQRPEPCGEPPVPRRSGSIGDGGAWDKIFIAGQVAIAVLPLAQVFLLRVLRDMVFVHGAVVGLPGTMLASFVLLAPYCLLAGFLLTLACSLAEPTAAPLDAGANSGIGRVYVADSLGSIGGGVLFSFVLVRWFDHGAMLFVPTAANLVMAALLAWRLPGRRGVWLAAVGVISSGCAVLAFLNLDAVSTARQFPGQRVVFRQNSPYGKLVVTEAAGQFNFTENGVPLFATHNTEQVEETVHYAMAQRPDAGRVLLIGGGIAGTAREILKYPRAEVTYVELDPLILAAGRKFLPNSLRDPRINVVNTDGRLFVKRTDKKFDVVIVAVPAPATAQLNRFYTAEFFNEVKRVLAPGGVLSFALGQYETYVSPELARLLASANATVRGAFQNVLVIPGEHVFFIAADAPLHADIAERLANERIPTQLVNRHYLDAMLTSDRLADVRRATAAPAAVNTDFNPVLYFYHLRHWLSQFPMKFGVVAVVALVLLAMYLVTLRAVSLAVFASGFAASALEVVLLLGLQVLYGSVYRQMGLIVTVFMAGLAIGAWLAMRQTRSLAWLAVSVAGLAALLPGALVVLGRVGATATALVAVQSVIALLTLILAMLVGMQFPVAARLDAGGTSVTAARLYTADFVGASLGAVLTSTVLIPLCGVTAVCWLTAALNALAGAVVWRRKS